MARIELDNISKHYPDGTVALHPTRLTIEDGEFFILVGPSGCGKSTLLNIMVGLTAPTAGEVRVDGRVVTGLDPRARNMAMVFQNYALYPHMTVGENIAFPLRMAGLDKRAMEPRVAAVAGMLELDELLGRRPAELSGGQRQRVAIARALLENAPILLLDEATSALDSQSEGLVQQALERLKADRTTIVIAHRLSTVRHADHILVIDSGRIVAQGVHAELVARGGLYADLVRLQLDPGLAAAG